MKHEPAKPDTLGLRPFRLWQKEALADPRIEIIPLIDVIFCVLTFFILAAVNLSRQQAINLNLPSAGSATTQLPDMTIVSLTDVGQIYVEKQLIGTQAQFSQIVRDYLERNPNGMVILNASEQRPYYEVIQILDWLKSIGGERVALGTASGTPTGQNLNFLFDEQRNPGLTPELPGVPLPPETSLDSPNVPLLPQASPGNPNADFEFDPVEGAGTLPAPNPVNDFSLEFSPVDDLGDPPSPSQIRQSPTEE